ncbi:MAG: imidazole glycerol phosphate synthase subunit HisH [Desulfobacterales bacterium]|nr:imidazole glycerol phosphate synthase subunit HisH [Desulfobacterales bacterium]MDD4391691.1 imidazole glycerol phosphate synthase subunit HisH [Desulfobacterales bacterium]
MIAIIDYQAGNQTSVQRALSYLGVPCKITCVPEEILAARRVIFPGVGAAGKAMEVIRSRGLDQVIREVVQCGTPFFGICLGTQIILDKSEENGNTRCIGIIAGMARKFPETVRVVPHMGWNTICPVRQHPVLAHIPPKAQFYFVHSYYPDPDNPSEVIATTNYGMDFASVIARDNVIATQFHPEKSGPQGLQLLKNFCGWDGKLTPC